MVKKLTKILLLSSTIVLSSLPVCSPQQIYARDYYSHKTQEQKREHERAKRMAGEILERAGMPYAKRIIRGIDWMNRNPDKLKEKYRRFRDRVLYPVPIKR